MLTVPYYVNDGFRSQLRGNECGPRPAIVSQFTYANDSNFQRSTGHKHTLIRHIEKSKSPQTKPIYNAEGNGWACLH